MRSHYNLLRLGAAGFFFTGLGWAQGPGLQNSNLYYVQTIPVPNWSVGVSNVDLFGFNPATRILYLADRTNHAIDVIDARISAVVGFIPLAANSVPNQPLVIPDLQQLAISDGVKSVFVYDLRAPGNPPDQYIMPSTTPDGMDYDPINRTLYVITDDSPYYLVGISLPYKQIVSQTKLPGSADLIRFNSIDGKIYIAAEDADNKNAGAGVYVYDPVAQAVTAQYTVGPACPGHGIDIDPISNVAVVGCFGGTSNGDMAINLQTGKVIKFFPDVGGTDSIVFDPSNRRFYAGAGLNSANTSGCPATPPSAFGTLVPIVGVFDAIGSGTANLDGVACTGRGNHIAGVDPIDSLIYVPVSQYPANPSSATTGQAGIVVFRDVTPPAQAAFTSASATLKPVGSGSVSGTVHMVLQDRRIYVDAFPTGIQGQAAWLTIPTTVGNELTPCAVNTSSASAVCGEQLIGDPLLGATVTLAVDFAAVARGTIAAP
jgi:hypothetical protein